MLAENKTLKKDDFTKIHFTSKCQNLQFFSIFFSNKKLILYAFTWQFFVGKGKEFSEIFDSRHFIQSTSFKMFFFTIKQDSRAIHYTSEVVNDTDLKYLKSVIVYFSWRLRNLPPQTPQPRAPFQTLCLYRCKVPHTHN